MLHAWLHGVGEGRIRTQKNGLVIRLASKEQAQLLIPGAINESEGLRLGLGWLQYSKVRHKERQTADDV